MLRNCSVTNFCRIEQEFRNCIKLQNNASIMHSWSLNHVPILGRSLSTITTLSVFSSASALLIFLFLRIFSKKDRLNSSHKMDPSPQNPASKVLFEKTEPNETPRPDPVHNVDSFELLRRSQGFDLRKVLNSSMMAGEGQPPFPQPPTARLTPEELNLRIPEIEIVSVEQVFSNDLRTQMLNLDVAIVRGIVEHCGLNLSLFSSEQLVKNHGQHPVHNMLQVRQPGCENMLNGRASWEMLANVPEDGSSTVDIAQYAVYQKDFGERETEEKEMTIKFGTNIDVENPDDWKEELTELLKLPNFARFHCPEENMLNHVGYPILGVNTVQLYMKVPGVRTSGHQEHNNMCSVNINVGPGDCEWFAVPDVYWHQIQKLCKRDRVEFVGEAWWPPNMEALWKNNIPVYRFNQRAGEMVWLSPGTVHWVQALESCNNIAWNVGPCTAEQYESSMKRYEWNKPVEYQSLIPMIHLSWKLAQKENINVYEPRLSEMIRTCLMKSLTQCFKIQEFVRSNYVKKVARPRYEFDHAHYCWGCKVEVFNLLFVKKKEEVGTVRCLKCAMKESRRLRSFVCFEEYKIGDLMRVYDNFVLQNEKED